MHDWLTSPFFWTLLAFAISLIVIVVRDSFVPLTLVPRTWLLLLGMLALFLFLLQTENWYAAGASLVMMILVLLDPSPLVVRLSEALCVGVAFFSGYPWLALGTAGFAIAYEIPILGGADFLVAHALLLAFPSYLMLFFLVVGQSAMAFTILLHREGLRGFVSSVSSWIGLFRGRRPSDDNILQAPPNTSGLLAGALAFAFLLLRPQAGPWILVAFLLLALSGLLWHWVLPPVSHAKQ
jgi:hypothetical protein